MFFFSSWKAINSVTSTNSYQLNATQCNANKYTTTRRSGNKRMYISWIQWKLYDILSVNFSRYVALEEQKTTWMVRLHLSQCFRPKWQICCYWYEFFFWIFLSTLTIVGYKDVSTLSTSKWWERTLPLSNFSWKLVLLNVSILFGR